jgi:hypothetical protein
MAYGNRLAGVPHHLDVDRASSENVKVSSPPIGGIVLLKAPYKLIDEPRSA